MINTEMWKIASKYEAKLEKGLNKKISFAYGNDCIIFYIYDNEYDYKRVSIKYTKGMDIDIVEFIKFYLSDEEYYTQHKASPLEIFVIELLKEHECHDMHVWEGLLYCNSEELILFDYVETFSYNKANNKLTVKDETEIVTVDFTNEVFTYVEVI